MIYCQQEDCDNCKYDDCIGTIRKKPGRKKMDPEVVKEHRRLYSLQYFYNHREKMNKYSKEYYYKKRDEKKNS